MTCLDGNSLLHFLNMFDTSLWEFVRGDIILFKATMGDIFWIAQPDDPTTWCVYDPNTAK